jgi:hypothetical protein
VRAGIVADPKDFAVFRLRSAWEPKHPHHSGWPSAAYIINCMSTIYPKMSA